MIDVFLSASVPLPTRDRRFFETADVLLIREAIKALVEVILPVGRITCGGHPAITPLLALFVRDGGLQGGHVTIFQSAFFGGRMPEENEEFLDVRIVPAVKDDRAASLTAMRRAMINSRDFAAAVVIGGMDGIFEEVELLGQVHPNARIIPVASTGAAAALVHKSGAFESDLAVNLTYPTLFRHHVLGLGA
jgi:hypothetical protein